MDYPPTDIVFKFYGKYTEQFVAQAAEMTDVAEQENALIHIARLMKVFHSAWNKERVSDETLKEHIAKLSGGKITLDVEKLRAKGLLDTSRRERAVARRSKSESHKEGTSKSFAPKRGGRYKKS